jgi:uncharacterized membrane protein
LPSASPPAQAHRPGHAAPGVHAHRVIFIDLARALAVVFMLYGHAVSALLAPEHRAGTWYDVWQFQRGLTASLFLMLSGFAFSVATSRRWPSHLRLGRPVLARTRRFLTFVLLGYALHFPVSRFAHLRFVAEEKWQSFLAIDVLQLIGMTFVGVQLLVLLARVRWLFTALALTLGAAVVLLTPAVWAADWTALPPAVAAYMSPATGSQFPLFPWAGYVLLGAGLGQVYAHRGAANLSAYANLGLLLPGAGLVIAGTLLRSQVTGLFGPGPSSFVPVEVLIRAGSCLVILAVMAHGSRLITRLPHIFGAVAQETLLIYFVHLCIVYGSVWNRGLAQSYGASLSPLRVLAVVIVLIGSMTLLAWGWNRVKHTSPRTARWVSAGVGTTLVALLL